MSESTNTSLEQILKRPDIWRGHSHHFVKQESVDTGFSELNTVLQHKGWPTRCLIEICQDFHASEWWLFHRSISVSLRDKNKRYIALLNPPALPMAMGLEQLGIPSQQLVIIQTKTQQEFISSFTELNKSGVFPLVLAWQLGAPLHYKHLRKIQLSTAEQNGVYVLFRHSQAKRQNSPASLRLVVTPQDKKIKIHIFKQRGRLRVIDIDLPIPHTWESLPSFMQTTKGKDSVIKQINKTGQVSLLPKISAQRRQDLRNDYH